jgi:hypothetical protein
MPAPRDPNWASRLDASAAPAVLVRRYENDEQLVDLVARFVGVGLVHGDAIVVFGTAPHRRAITERLTEVGFDLDVAGSKRQIHLHDAQTTLDRLLTDGSPDERRFLRVVGDILTGAAGVPTRRTRVFGEMLDLCWRSGDVSSALRLEAFWNAYQRDHVVDVLLAYAKANEFCEATAGA